MQCSAPRKGNGAKDKKNPCASGRGLRRRVLLTPEETGEEDENIKIKVSKPWGWWRETVWGVVP
jgi:hypothetical protein